jgi:hypothetical protein
MTQRDENLRCSLAEKLRPDRFPNTCGKMASIVGYILDEPFPAAPGGHTGRSSDPPPRSDAICAN